MATLRISGTVTDSSGASYSFETDAVSSSITASATVTPATAPVGTTRIYKYNATSSAGLPITYATPVAPGVVFTPVAGDPTSFSFIY